MVTAVLQTAGQKKTLPASRERFSCTQTALAHPPRAVRLTAGGAASKLGPAMDIDLLRIVGATIAGRVAIIIADLQITVGVALWVSPIIAGMGATCFKTAVIGIDFVAAVLAIQAVAA